MGKEGKGDASGRRKEDLDRLRYGIGELQRRARDAHIPLVIVFEGWDIWGRAEHINRLTRSLDPRGFDLYYMAEANGEERTRPFLWRYHSRMPERGRVAIFDRSWYFWSVYEQFKREDRERWERRIRAIRSLEEEHVRAGWVIIKFFLNLERKDLKQTLERHGEQDFCRAQMEHVNGEDLVEDYKRARTIWRKAIQSTDFEFAPWTLIEETDDSAVGLRIMQRVQRTLEPILDDPSSRPCKECRMSKDWEISPSLRLPTVDLGKRCPGDEYKERLEKLQTKLHKLQCRLYTSNRSLMLVFEGWDAAGKGGVILRLTNQMNPRAYRVVPVSAPNEVESKHHWLWRFYKEAPRTGHVAIFDRSWYGRVLVERVEGFTPEEEWKRAYREINEMERHLTDEGGIVEKFWLHIDQDTQYKRFKEREASPYKHWKMSPEDWRNRDRWEKYLPAVEEMLARTDSKPAPWRIIPAVDKYYARIKVLDTVVDRLEKELGRK